MSVSELAPGLWRWTARTPDWTEGDDWDPEVGCVYYEAADATVLVDPLVPPERERFLEALDRDVERRGLPVAILLTCPWHERSRAELTERYDRRRRRAAPASSRFRSPRSTRRSGGCPSTRALVVGDVHLRRGGRCAVVCSGLLARRPLVARLDPGALCCPLLELPIERVLVSHGEPVLVNGSAALERALAT